MKRHRLICAYLSLPLIFWLYLTYPFLRKKKREGSLHANDLSRHLLSGDRGGVGVWLKDEGDVQIDDE
jgi:amino acid permease